MEKIYITKDILQKLVLDGYSQKQMANILSVSEATINRNITAYQFPNKQHFTYEYNQCFVSEESNEKYYFFGFCLGDGALVSAKKRLALRIILHKKDKCILENFTNWFELDSRKIKSYSYSKREIVSLELMGDCWQTDFSSLGLVPRKTYNPSMLNIPIEFLRPFIIGYIDADGSVTCSKRARSISIVGHPYNIDWFISSIRLLGFTGNINFQYPNGIWKRASINRNADIKQLVDILNVREFNNIYLARKWNKIATYYDPHT